MTVLHTAQDRARWVAYLETRPFPQEVGCADYKPARRDEANDYLWGFAYPPLVAACGFTALEWHEHFCGEFFGMVEHVRIDGKIDYRPRRTTTRNESGKRSVLKGPEFNKFLMFVESECASRGVYVERACPV